MKYGQPASPNVSASTFFSSLKPSLIDLISRLRYSRWALATSATIVAIFLGLLLGLGFDLLIIFFAAIVAGIFFLIFPMVGLWGSIIASLIFAGLIDLYLPSLTPLKWGLLLLSGGVGLIGLVRAALGRKYLHTAPNQNAGFWLILFILGYLLSVILSTTLNWHGFKALAVGFKGYFQVWGLILAIYYLIHDEINAARLMKFLLLLGLIQLPFVLHQFIFLVPKRNNLIAAEHGVVAVDVVSGTFGGSMNSGGRSSSLALLLVISFTLLLAQWRIGLASFKKLVLFGLILFFPLLLNEAKIVVVLIPVMFFILFQDLIIKNPLKYFLGFSTVVMAIGLIFTIYYFLPGEGDSSNEDFTDYVQESVDYNLGNKGYGGLALNRTTVYPFWLNEQLHEGFLKIIAGNGPGQTNGGSFLLRDTLASTKYLHFGIGLTGLDSLLWEIGLFGTFMVLGLLTSAYQLGGKLAKYWQGTVNWPLIKTAQISIPLFALNLLHNNFFVVDLSFQALFALLIGYLLVMTKFERTKP